MKLSTLGARVVPLLVTMRPFISWTLSPPSMSVRTTLVKSRIGFELTCKLLFTSTATLGLEGVTITVVFVDVGDTLCMIWVPVPSPSAMFRSPANVPGPEFVKVRVAVGIGKA